VAKSSLEKVKGSAPDLAQRDPDPESSGEGKVTSHQWGLLRQLPCPVLIFDLSGYVIEYNSKVIDLLGYSGDDLKGLALKTIYPDEATPYHIPQLIDSLRLDKSENINARIISNDRSTHNYTHEFSLYRDEEGKEKGIICVLRKIYANDRASESPGLHEDIFQASSNFLDIFYLDTNFIYREVNQSHLDLIQKKYDEVIGKNISEIHR